MIGKQMIYAVPEKFSLKKMGAQLSGKLESKVERFNDVCRAYLDTFDWRLYRSGLVLEMECRDSLCVLICRELGSGRILLSRTVRRLPKNAGDFSSAGIQPKLKQILGRRSLIAHAALNGHTERLLLLNEDEKTIMRVELRRDQVILPKSAAHHRLGGVVYLFPYRGYEMEFKGRLTRALKDGILSSIAEDPLMSALNALDITPGQYTGRPTFSLDGGQPAIESLVQILKRFLQVIDSNIEGARKDEDPEYLHDFLVAIRRTSIFLHKFSSVFPAKNLMLIEHGFQWIEQEAMSIRDLDLYMNLFDDFESRVDANHRQSLKSLYLFLKGQKKHELRRMRVSLESPRYFRLIESWNDFLLNCQNSDRLPKTAYAPIGRIARDCIWDIYRELLRKSESVLLDSKVDEICELHQISKHLGYHMDVFRSLFPVKRISRLLKAHDKLQSRLNQFKDMDLQYGRLREYKSKMKKVQAVRKISLEAVEQLIADRKREKARALEKVMNQIERFTRKKMRIRFNSMLAMPDKGSDA